MMTGAKLFCNRSLFARQSRIGARKCKPAHSSSTAPNQAVPLAKGPTFTVSAFSHIRSCVSLGGCEQNSFVPPPPPKVDVALPVQRNITRYLEATGNSAAIKTVDLVARVQGFLEAINYQDGEKRWSN